MNVCCPHCGGTLANLSHELASMKFGPFTFGRPQSKRREVLIPRTFGELIAHFRQKELSHGSHEHKSYATQETYLAIIDTWILPQWREHRPDSILAVEVEDWLATIPRTRGTKAKIRNVMSALCSYAMRHGWLKTNPIKGVRQSAKRERVKEPLDVEELQTLYAALAERERVLVMLDVPTGMRVGELLALHWCDFDFKRKIVDVRKSIWRQHIGPVKTEESEKQMPLSDEMIADILAWRAITPYRADDDWVFASPKMDGKQPYWPDALMKNIRKVAKRVGITKRLSWHVFRHTFSTLLIENGEDVKTVQSLMRHANVRVTLETYAHASAPRKRAAQSRVSGLMKPVQKAS